MACLVVICDLHLTPERDKYQPLFTYFEKNCAGYQKIHVSAWAWLISTNKKPAEVTTELTPFLIDKNDGVFVCGLSEWASSRNQGPLDLWAQENCQ